MSDQIAPLDEPDDTYDGDGQSYLCLSCGWLGRGGASAYLHHKDAHHPIVLTFWPGAGPVSFACCQPIKVKQAV